MTITTYNTKDTVGISCVGSPQPPSQGITINFKNTSASPITVTLGDPYYLYPATPAGQTDSYNSTNSWNVSHQFPTAAPVNVQVYLNKATNPSAVCTGTMAATGATYTITMPSASSCTISSP